jgi:CRP-like cAMP-binding protein
MNLSPEIQEKVECLKQISLFKDLCDDDNAMEVIAHMFTTAAFGQGDTVFQEKIYGDSMYIIKEGTVEIIKKTMQGDSYVVANLSADMHVFFGEVALLDPDERSATVRCKTTCEFYVLTREKFLLYGDEYPHFGLVITREISRILCRRLRKSNADIVTLFDALVDEVEKSGGLQ